MNIFELKNDFIKHLHISYNVINIYIHLFNLEKIQNIFISRIFNEDFENVRKENMNINVFDEKNLEKISFDNSKTHLDLNIDTIYIMRSKRISKLFQKI